jgi:hypothetical protein
MHMIQTVEQRGNTKQRGKKQKDNQLLAANVTDNTYNPLNNTFVVNDQSNSIRKNHDRPIDYLQLQWA